MNDQETKEKKKYYDKHLRHLNLTSSIFREKTFSRSSDAIFLKRKLFNLKLLFKSSHVGYLNATISQTFEADVE